MERDGKGREGRAEGKGRVGARVEGLWCPAAALEDKFLGLWEPRGFWEVESGRKGGQDWGLRSHTWGPA